MFKSAIWSFGLLTISHAVFAEDCFKTDYQKQLFQYQLSLNNQCETPVTWAYALCSENKQIQRQTVSLEPFQHSRMIIEETQPVLLYVRTCQDCQPVPPTCNAEYIPVLDEREMLQNSSLLLREKTIQATSHYVQLLSAELPRVEQAHRQVLYVGDKPLNTNQIYQRLVALKGQPHAETLLVAKPYSVTKLKAKESSLDAEQFSTPGSMRAPRFKSLITPNKKQKVKPASCIVQQVSQRNWLGKSEVSLKNLCPHTMNVGLRICAGNELAQQKVLSLSSDESSTEWVSYNEQQTIQVKIRSCAGESCTPAIPTSCTD